MKVIPHSRQSIDSADIQAVAEVLKSDIITQGDLLLRFEKALAKYCGSKYAVCVSSATAGLHLGCLCAGLRKGKEAITSPITFLATANAALYTGADVVFADIDYETADIDPAQIEKKITKKTGAILPVHFGGLPCDMPRISAMAKAKGIAVIEDASHALGAAYKCKGRWIKVGSCKHSDMTVLSFHVLKNITTGEGGAVTTNSRDMYEKLRALRSHGVYKGPDIKKRYGPWYYEMRHIGFNYRITDFQCALGLSQLGKADRFLREKRAVAAIYDKAFEGIKGVATPVFARDKRYAFHLYVLRIDFDKIRMDRRDLMNSLARRGIMTQVHYIPVYRQPYYKKRYSYSGKDFPESEAYYKRALSIPLYNGIMKKDAYRVVETLKALLEA